MQGIVDRVGPGDINVNRREAPNFSDYHQAPRRQYVVNLEGIAEFECADGSKVQLEPGDILVAEDLSGHGHIARSPFRGDAYLPGRPPRRAGLTLPLHEWERGGFETRPYTETFRPAVTLTHRHAATPPDAAGPAGGGPS